MPKRKVVLPSKKIEAAFKKARKKPKEATPEQVAIRGRILRSPEKDPEAQVSATKQKGKEVFIVGTKKWQPGTVHHPQTIAIAEAARDFLAEEVKRKRKPPMEAARQARLKDSQRPKVIELLHKYGLDNPQAPGWIADELGISSGYVRQIRAKV